MKKPLIILLHLGFWGCYLILIMVILGVLYGNSESVPEQEIERTFNMLLFFGLVPSIITFYSFYLVIFPKFLQQKKYGQAVGIGLLIAYAAGMFGYFCLNRTFGYECEGLADDEGNVFLGVSLVIGFISLIAGIVALVIQGCINWLKERQLKEQLTIKNQEMELALVKAQLDPHFLFNTINNIDILILKNATKASDYLNKLSDIMRFTLFETKTAEIPLSKELEYIEKYIELQRIRTANDCYVQYEVKGCPKNRTIAPMVFIPFIENAFKHTTNKKLEKAIDIQIQIQNGQVNLACANKLDPHRQAKIERNGLGNDLIKKRLALLYPNRHTLDVQHQPNLYNVNLTIEHGTI